LFQSHLSQGNEAMLEFDQSTLANMTAALEWVCKKIPSGQDTPEVRKQIADSLIACAKSGRRTYVDFQDVGAKRLVEITKQSRSRWFGWFR
jgi:cytosine/adenosine deaminase-related metal-dependent hydrolase